MSSVLPTEQYENLLDFYTDMDKTKLKSGGYAYTIRGDFFLYICGTNYASDYMLPHLMDDLNYRAQVINQNCAYNQPPHLSFDPVTYCTVEREMKPFEVLEDGKAVTKHWDSFYTTYPMTIPENVTAWAVTGYSKDGTDALTLKQLTSGTVIPGKCGVIVKSDDANATWVPAPNSTVAVSTVYLKGDYCDSTLVCNDETNEQFYVFKEGERGLGYYKANEQTVEGGTAFLRIKASTSTVLADSYVLGDIAPSPTAIEDVDMDAIVNKGNDGIYTLQGVKVSEITAPGTYIRHGKKVWIR